MEIMHIYFLMRIITFAKHIVVSGTQKSLNKGKLLSL